MTGAVVLMALVLVLLVLKIAREATANREAPAKLAEAEAARQLYPSRRERVEVARRRP